MYLQMAASYLHIFSLVEKAHAVFLKLQIVLRNTLMETFAEV